MKRDLMQSLLMWKNDPLRMPLVLRGARQVGKSWIVESFAKNFSHYIELNFELDDDAHDLFAGRLGIKSLIEKIELYSGKKIVFGETLLFLDEIQECERAVKTLRYFKEKCPELHVIAAGSLLDFLLDEIGLPVGRVQFLFLQPLSFGEFLTVNERADLREYINTGESDPTIHKLILEYLKTYMWLGGMPAVVDAWLKFKDAKKCQSLQDRILIAYRQDFLKYAKKNQIKNVEKVFVSIPQQLGGKFKYTKVDQTVKSNSIKNALNLLVKAGVAYQCFRASGQGFPLAANKNEKYFKVFFFDIGLAQRILGLNLQKWVTTVIDTKYIGAITEQLVAQEYVAYSVPEKPRELYYWCREESSGNAEVDFLFTKNNNIIPVEVKSGVQGGMKSMHYFLETHPHSTYGLKVSQGIKQEVGRIQEISLYGIEWWVLV